MSTKLMKSTKITKSVYTTDYCDSNRRSINKRFCQSGRGF